MGTNQLTIGPNPKPRLNFISGISRYLAHILCIFLFFCHWEEDSRKVDSFGRGYSVFRSLYERELTTGNFGLFLNYATAFPPGRKSSLFFAPSQTRLHRISQPGKHHRQKDGGGDEPINNWSRPQPRLNFISGISRYLAHILCTFLFCHWEEDSRKVDSFGRGYSVFRSLYERELTGNFGLF